ncbi:MAG: succinate dehydrogenase/fumarate reductase cytochrome b subunit, partial [Reinekea sp.]
NSLLDIFAAPFAVFSRIKDKSLSAWVPLLIMVSLSAAVTTWYFLTIDLYQFMEVSMLMSGQEASPEELNQILKAESVIRVSSAAIGSLSSLVIYIILALYFFLISLLVAENKTSYGQWLSVISWASLPSLLSLLSIGVSYALIVPEFSLIQALDKTSISALLGLTWEDKYFNVLSTATIGALWSYALYGIGFKVLTQCKPVTAVIVALVPVTIQFGLMSL